MQQKILNDSIILTGPVGSCKSLISSNLSQKLGMPRIELDEFVRLPSLYELKQMLSEQTDEEKKQRLSAQLDLRQKFPNVPNYEQMGFDLAFSRKMDLNYGTVGWHCYRKQFEIRLLEEVLSSLQGPAIIDMGGTMGVAFDEYNSYFLEEFAENHPDQLTKRFPHKDSISFERIRSLLSPFKTVVSMHLPKDYIATMPKAAYSKLNNFLTKTDQYDKTATFKVSLNDEETNTRLIDGNRMNPERLDRLTDSIIRFRQMQREEQNFLR